MPLALLAAVVQFVLGALILLGVLWIAKLILRKSEMVLPGGRVERLAVLIVVFAITLWAMGFAPVSDEMAGLFVLVAGLIALAAYKMDDATEMID